MSQFAKWAGVSCGELDNECFQSRLRGAGFGWCTENSGRRVALRVDQAATTLSRRQTPRGRAGATVEAFARPGRQTRRSRACAYPVPGSVGAGCVWRRFKVLPLLPNSYTQERWPTTAHRRRTGRCSKGPGLKCSLRHRAEARTARSPSSCSTNIQPQPVSLRTTCCRGRGKSTLCGERWLYLAKYIQCHRVWNCSGRRRMHCSLRRTAACTSFWSTAILSSKLSSIRTPPEASAWTANIRIRER